MLKLYTVLFIPGQIDQTSIKMDIIVDLQDLLLQAMYLLGGIMDFFVSDTHFGHTNIIRYCNRPFRTADDMDKVMLDNINAVVGPDDTLWHGGDFSFGHGTNPQTIEFTRRQIICKNIRLIVGNHDRLIVGSQALKGLFTEVLNYYLGEIGGRRFLITHRPPTKTRSLDDWNWEKTLWDREQAQDPNLICLHGHTHNNSCLGPRNMCVEVLGYKPISLPDVLKRFNQPPVIVT